MMAARLRTSTGAPRASHPLRRRANKPRNDHQECPWGCYNPSDMKHSLAVLFTLANLAIPAAHGQRRSKTTFNVVEATIPPMQVALKKKKRTSREFVQRYLIRIGT